MRIRVRRRHSRLVASGTWSLARPVLIAPSVLAQDSDTVARLPARAISQRRNTAID